MPLIWLLERPLSDFKWKNPNDTILWVGMDFSYGRGYPKGIRSTGQGASGLRGPELIESR